SLTGGLMVCGLLPLRNFPRSALVSGIVFSLVRPSWPVMDVAPGSPDKKRTSAQLISMKVTASGPAENRSQSRFTVRPRRQATRPKGGAPAGALSYCACARRRVSFDGAPDRRVAFGLAVFDGRRLLPGRVRGPSYRIHA